MSTATPIPISAATVHDGAAERLGYLYVAICRHCHEAIVILNSEPPYMVKPPAWRHRDHDGRRTCSPELVQRQREWEARHPEPYR
jgi:hypothetical protein